eukprot:TRINITY_DN3832_c0_g1_i1.p1 TRINITY_DN3832_c0_g1~~TRINITY_DN3832_c0_g1_i1.p1  ORF type:complete len:574 (+),score=34.80 TRINITY_DN3832_c0_g1_i1:52-1722(+)
MIQDAVRLIILMANSILSVIFLCVAFQLASSKALATQLTDPWFPDRYPSSRALVNNKRTFKAYSSQTMLMTVLNFDVKSASIYINGKPCDISEQVRSGAKEYVVDISKLIRDGDSNTLSVQNIEPKGTHLEIYIPYPYLTEGKPEEVGFDPKKLGKVDELIKSDIERGFPGAALIICKDGKIVKRATYGYARKFKDDGTLMEKFEDLSLNTLFDMASNTKMFATAFSLMKLFAEEKFKYVDSLHKYIPEYSGTDKNGEKREDRLIIDLLAHVAGYLPDPHFFNPDEIPPEEYTQNKNRTAEILYHIHGFDRKRGGVPVYSDVDYMILGLLIEKLSGMPLDQYAESEIYAKLQLKNSLFNPLRKGYKISQFAATEVLGNTYNWTVKYPHIRTEVIQGTVDDPKSYYCMDGTAGAAGLFSTVDDMAVMCQVLLNKGGYGKTKLWNRDTQDLFVKPYDTDLTFGAGWRRAANEDLNWHFSAYASPYAIGHTGWTGTVTVIDPKYDLSIVLLTNKKHSKYYDGKFEGDTFATGKYGDIVQLIYEAFLTNQYLDQFTLLLQ